MPKVDFGSLKETKEESKEEPKRKTPLTKVKENQQAKKTLGGFGATKTQEKPFDELSEAKKLEVMKEEILDKPQGIPKPKITPKINEEEKYEIQVLDKNSDLSTVERERPLTLEEKKLKMRQNIELVNFMAQETFKLNEDYYRSPNGKYAITRGGYNKLAVMFNISTETLKIWVEYERDEKGNEDIVAYARVKATRLNGTYVIITGKKCKSEYWSDKNQNYGYYNRHTLEATAETRAHNRAIQNAIGFIPKGFMGVSYEEMQSNTSKGFGGK